MEDNILKYPVLMVHGMGFRDNKLISYWGRIPKELEKMGCRLYYGGQDSNGTIETNAAVIAERIEYILKKENTDKVNIIAHSKGGLDARYAISTMGLGKMLPPSLPSALPITAPKPWTFL